MTWRERTLMKLNLIAGKVFNRIKDFMARRTIQFGAENEKSSLIVSIMSNEIQPDIGRSLFANDGALWKTEEEIYCREIPQDIRGNQIMVKYWVNRTSAISEVLGAETESMGTNKIKMSPSQTCWSSIRQEEGELTWEHETTGAADAGPDRKVVGV